MERDLAGRGLNPLDSQRDGEPLEHPGLGLDVPVHNLDVDAVALGELDYNLKTAKALGLTIPQTVLLQADQVIQGACWPASHDRAVLRPTSPAEVVPRPGARPGRGAGAHSGVRLDSPAAMRLIGLAVILAVGLSLAPQPAATTPRIGVLGPTPMNPSNDVAFKQGLAQFGYTEGRNLVIEYRHAEGRLLSDLAAQLVRLNVDVIFARGAAAVAAAKVTTGTIPVVAVDLESDPVAAGFVRGLAQPGGNITGVFLDLPELSGKQLQLLKELLPQLSRVAVLGDPVLNAPQFRATEIAAGALACFIHERAHPGSQRVPNGS